MKILYVCAANSTRSQIAESFLNRMTSNHVAYSAGANPDLAEGEYLHASVIRCMGEFGCDLSTKRRKRITPEMVESADKVIVVLQPHEAAKYIPEYVWSSGKTCYWNVKDHEWSYKSFVSVRDVVRSKVTELLKELDAP